MRTASFGLRQAAAQDASGDQGTRPDARGHGAPEGARARPGLSIAARHATPAKARGEALRLHASNLDSDPGTTARTFTVAGVPGALGIRIDGEGARAYAVAFTDGADLVELFVIAKADDVRKEPFLKAVRALYARSLA